MGHHAVGAIDPGRIDVAGSTPVWSTVRFVLATIIYLFVLCIFCKIIM